MSPPMYRRHAFETVELSTVQKKTSRFRMKPARSAYISDVNATSFHPYRLQALPERLPAQEYLQSHILW